jgi:histidyl-tRNA synthetase
MQKPSLPKGVRDFDPITVQKRNYIFDTLRGIFTKYGYQPIETPVLEKLSTLTGKYGEEGDKLLFKILNSGDYFNKLKPEGTEALENKESQKLTKHIAEKGLRYDLTVPFARYVVMHQNDISFPFKRYQIQPVWRADRPQKGRYREFFQCDVDVVGSPSLMYEAELAQIFDEAFHALNIKVEIRINNRKILQGLAEIAGIEDKFIDMTVAIDKLDKIGVDGVKRELEKREITASAIDSIIAALEIKDLDTLSELLAKSEVGQKGIAELRAFHQYFDLKPAYNKIVFDITLARGLNYYTGCIFEVAHDATVYPDQVMGSIGGGGRYDDLTSGFGLKDVSGVGVSFGADRIYDVMEEQGLFPAQAVVGTQVLFVALDDEAHPFAFDALGKLRDAGISAALYPAPTKMKKQMKYANDIGVPYVVIIGNEEMTSGELVLKNMQTGDQEKLSLEKIIATVKK